MRGTKTVYKSRPNWRNICWSQFKENQVAAVCNLSLIFTSWSIFFWWGRKSLVKYSQICYKFLLIGDFNLEESEAIIFFHDYNAVNIIPENPCCKSRNNPKCIDLIITNSRNSFQKRQLSAQGYLTFINF